MLRTFSLNTIMGDLYLLLQVHLLHFDCEYIKANYMVRFLFLCLTVYTSIYTRLVEVTKLKDG
jgi:hypothetical protein